MNSHPGLKEFCTELRSSQVPSAPLLCFMVAMYEEEAMSHKGTPEGKQSLDTALEVSLTFVVIQYHTIALTVVHKLKNITTSSFRYLS